jgi:myo-inositol-1-phosphate synthase
MYGGWDAFPEDTGILEEEHLNAVREALKEVKSFPAVFDPRYVARIEATHEKEYGSLREAAEQVREDIRTFKSEHGLERAVIVNCASTEAYTHPPRRTPTSTSSRQRWSGQIPR